GNLRLQVLDAANGAVVPNRTVVTRYAQSGSQTQTLDLQDPIAGSFRLNYEIEGVAAGHINVDLPAVVANGTLVDYLQAQLDARLGPAVVTVTRDPAGVLEFAFDSQLARGKVQPLTISHSTLV